MPEAMVDSNVLLDILTEDPLWFPWSSQVLERVAEDHILVINPIIFAEVSIRYDRIEDLDDALPRALLERRPIPWEAAFLAGKCFLRYRRQSGQRRSVLPDFFIGAHAAVDGMVLLTRDEGRYKTYFPTLKILSPS
jgi:predicted nucleic acid-binding protein